jgi:hypothetical protein
MKTLKNAVQRGFAFAAASTMLGAVITSAMPALTSADALNPLTERSLTLSSSSPGFHYLDGSGNSTYAAPGTGNNGQKTSETFSYKMSSDTTSNPIKAITFQYCTGPAGQCTAPGNQDVGTSNPATTSNLNIHYTSPVEGTDFAVYTGGSPTGGGTVSTGWAMTTSRVADNPAVAGDEADEAAVPQNNFITLKNTTGAGFAAGTQFWIKFYANAAGTNYIQNPGSDAFFVKINTYNDDTTLDNTTIIDGGVTVANVMNDSIWLQTKVLETMYFSVGTVNPDTVTGTHGTCDAISVNAPLKLGDSTQEDSLKTTQAYDQFSYWRLSSNSSNGATVYYSGNTLSNTENDQIDAIGTTKAKSLPGTEQFGLAIDSHAYDGTGSYPAIDTGNAPAAGFSANTVGPLSAFANYGSGAGTITAGGTAEFAFDPNSLTDPVPFASESTDIVHCATARMRYIANIAPDTPSGVYTSKINYIASPQY